MPARPLIAASLLLCLGWPLAGSGQTPARAVEAKPLSLAQAEARLETANREIIAAQRSLEIASARVGVAGAVPNPTLSAQVSSINPIRGIGAGGIQNKQVDSVLHIDQLVERGGKRELRIASAESDVQAVRRDLAEIIRQQRLAVQSAYFDLKLALEKRRILADTARLQSESLNAAERRLQAGDASESEVVRFRVEALRSVNDARAAEADVARAQQALAILIGLDASYASIQPSDDWPSGLPLGSSAEPDPEQLKLRPDVQAAQARVETAERNRELARRLRTRDVTVGAQVERFPPDPGLMYGMSVSVPLFVRYYFEGEIAQSEAELTASMAARDKTLALAQADVRRAQTDLLSAAERQRRLYDDLLPQARRALDSAEFAYKNGATGLIDLLDARRTLRALDLEAVTATGDFAKARAALLFALAGSNFRPDARPNP